MNNEQFGKAVSVITDLMGANLEEAAGQRVGYVLFVLTDDGSHFLSNIRTERSLEIVKEIVKDLESKQ